MGMALCTSLQRVLCSSSGACEGKHHRQLAHSVGRPTSHLASEIASQSSMSAQAWIQTAPLSASHPATSCPHQFLGPISTHYKTTAQKHMVQASTRTVETPTQAASSSSHPDPSYNHMPHSAMDPDLKREIMCGSLNAALDQHNSELQSCFPAGAPLELLRAAKLCIELTKQQASNHLKAHIPLKDSFAVRPIKEQLAAGILGKVNVWNGVPELRWTDLSPAVMVPLLECFMDSGYADEFGLPIFRQQDPQPRIMGLQEFLAFKIKEPDFIGSEEEVFCDDAMWVYPAKAPVIGTSKLGDLITQPAFLEQVLAGYPAGRQLLNSISTVCTGIGMQWGNSCGAVSTSAESGRWACVFDLVARRPLAVLGALFLSEPEMPFAVFLRAVAAAAVGGATAGVLGKVPAKMQLLRKLQDGWEALVCAGEGGERVWGWGHLTAVGAGEDGGSGGLRVVVPVYQRRPQGVSGASKR